MGGVLGTPSSIEDEFNVAGWALAVLYEDSHEPIRNLTLFLGLEAAGAAAASVRGFWTLFSGQWIGDDDRQAVEI